VLCRRFAILLGDDGGELVGLPLAASHVKPSSICGII
jgi:hypothetical protein